MSKIIIPFVPQPVSAFQFNVTLDTQPLTGVVPWGVFRQDWYLSLQGPNQNVIVYRALVGSPDGVPIQNMSWANGIVYVQTQNPHNIQYLSTVNLTISDCDPIVLNGIQSCFITGPDTFIYKYAPYPGTIVQFGTMDQNINLAEGYFFVTSLVFRESTQNFEAEQFP